MSDVQEAGGGGGGESVVKLAATIDWFTGTHAVGAGYEAAVIYGRHVVSREAALGNSREPSGSHGYAGWRAGQAQWGDRRDGCILVASGGLADDVWQHAVALGYRASRLDLAVTAWFEPARVGLALDAYKRARDHRPDNGRVPAATYIVSSLGGSTCYIGSRASETFGRLYDKAVQSRAESDRGAWRWEVEVKAERAALAARVLLDSSTRRESIRARVWQWFADRGVEPSWDGAGDAIASDPVGRQSDDTRRAEWLATQVAPTVRDLIPRIGMRTVLEALGLDPEAFVDENRSGIPPRGVTKIAPQGLTLLRRDAGPEHSKGGS